MPQRSFSSYSPGFTVSLILFKVWISFRCHKEEFGIAKFHSVVSHSCLTGPPGDSKCAICWQWARVIEGLEVPIYKDWILFWSLLCFLRWEGILLNSPQSQGSWEKFLWEKFHCAQVGTEFGVPAGVIPRRKREVHFLGSSKDFCENVKWFPSKTVNSFR